MAIRGYRIEAVERFLREVAYVESAENDDQRNQRMKEMKHLQYNVWQRIDKLLPQSRLWKSFWNAMLRAIQIVPLE